MFSLARQTSARDMHALHRSKVARTRERQGSLEVQGGPLMLEAKPIHSILLKPLPAQMLEESLPGGNAPEEGAEAPERKPEIASYIEEPLDFFGDANASPDLKACA